MEQNKISQAGDSEDAPFQHPPDPACRILVVDDDADIRRINTEILANAGYTVESAGDGAAAWDILQHQSYDLLITDNSMPKMSGMDLVNNLQEAHLALPTIMVTGVPPPEVLNQYSPAHIEAVLLKPYTAAELLAKVRNVLLANDRPAGSAAPLPSPPNRPAAENLRPE
jgi:CheY-like chemotaxis protein